MIKLLNITILVFLISSCSVKVFEDNNIREYIVPRKDFVEQIKKIDEETSLLNLEELLYNENFLKIYNNPDMYCYDALMFFRDQATTEKQKNIAGLLMHKLSSERFIWFLEGLYYLCRDNLLEDGYLTLNAYAPSSFGICAIQRITNKRLVSLLKVISKDPLIELKYRESIIKIEKQKGIISFNIPL